MSTVKTKVVRIGNSRGIRIPKVILDQCHINDEVELETNIDNHYIEAVIPGSMFLNAGIFSIKVVNPAPDGGISNSVNLQITNPIPAITALDPAETMAGTTSLTVNVHGTGFFDDTTVYVNAEARSFSLISQTNLQVELTAEDLEAGAYLEITASNPPPGGGLSEPAVFTVLNPIPTLSSIDPATIIAGSPGFDLTLTGDNFVKTSVVSFNGQQFPITYISKTQIEATIPSEAIETAGDYPVTVINPAPGGGVSEDVIFTVTQATSVEPLPEGSFGEQYEDLIPSDASIESYDSNRFSIITGKVEDRDQDPLSGVTVSIHSHPEYGTAQTDSNGKFSIPVEGGGTITVVYEKSGLITAHRKVDVPWNEISIAETITMIPEDTVSTTVSFNGDPSSIITHQSSIVTDDRGSRSLTMVFTGDNRAFAVDENNNEVELTTITTRATEFDTPESMPAVLPPNSAYTYAAELSVDGAKSVRFEKPIVTYVDNFLGFDIGEIVPVGYYDRERAVWVPSDNGVVVMLLDTNSDGVVDALDSTGDGLPDDLNGNGSFSDEVTGLDDSAKYQPDSSYWRVEIDHFTPWDCNWPFGPPEDAIEPNPDGEPIPDEQQDDDDKDCGNSYVERRGRIFHEDVPIPGTDMTLHYASSRVKGYKSVITIPASGGNVPASLKRIIVKMQIAGRVFETNLAPLPNQKVEFVWDGLDYLGNPVAGSRTGLISIGFVYDAVFYSAGASFWAFAQAGIQAVSISTRQELISWKQSEVIIHRLAEISTLANGWTLSEHHYLDPASASTLFKGDGTINNNDLNIINTVAGNGVWGYRGDGGPATQARLQSPSGVAVDREGNIFIADTSNYRIRKVDTSGIITTVAGNGVPTFNGDGGPATSASIRYPSGVAVDSVGNIYIADKYNSRIRKVDTNGIISTVAGNGVYGYSGDGGPATEAGIKYPRGVTVDSAGNIFIADTFNHRVRKVDISGIITTVAGNGQKAFSGDGGPATEAGIKYPQDIAVDSKGNIFIADAQNSRVRKVDTDGIITTVAGNGVYGYSGDGGPPTEAQLDYPTGLDVDSVGNIYIADVRNNRIRMISSSLSSPLPLMTDSIAGDIFFADKNGLFYHLDSAGHHKYTIDLTTGKTLLTFGYDQNNQIISITDRFGDQTSIQRDASGVPISITSPDGIVTGLTIDTNNNLTKVTYPDSSFYSFNYTADNLMTDEYDPNNNLFEHQYDENGRLTHALDPEGGSWSYSREVDSASNVSVNVLTGENNLTTYQDHTDSTGAYTSVKTDPTGGVSTISRSGDGLSETRELSCGTNLTMTYDIDSEYKYKYLKEFTRTSPAGLTQTAAKSRTYEDTDADDIPDLITDMITINENDWIFTDNTLDGVITGASPSGRTVTIDYDSSDLLLNQLLIPGLSPVSFTHDSRGRFKSASIGARTISVAYDENGNLDYITTPDNKTFDYTYDIMGRLKYEYLPDGTSVQYDYDNNGNVTALTNPKNIPHSFGYTANDQRKTYTAPLSGSYLYAYDKERKLRTVTFPSGKVISNTYTNGRLTSTQTPEGTTNFEYGCANMLSLAAKGSESLFYAYDGSLLTSVASSGVLNQAINYTYNNDFRISSMTYAGAVENFGYDNDGLLTTAGGYTITRNAQNGLPGSVSDGALTHTRTFSGYGEIDGYSNTINSSDVYTLNATRDLSGRITQRIEVVDGSTVIWDYAYDDLGRLIEAKKDSIIVESYTYDDNGNRTLETNTLRGIASRALTYSDEDHLITAGTDTYQFDVDGFLTQKTTSAGLTTFDYSSRGELLNTTLSNGTIISYDHDPMGRRITKKVDGVIVEKYLWTGTIKLLAVFDGSDNLVMRFEYADARRNGVRHDY